MDALIFKVDNHCIRVEQGRVRRVSLDGEPLGAIALDIKSKNWQITACKGAVDLTGKKYLRLYEVIGALLVNVNAKLGNALMFKMSGRVTESA